jgi:hypothetical protein
VPDDDRTDVRKEIALMREFFAETGKGALNGRNWYEYVAWKKAREARENT